MKQVGALGLDINGEPSVQLITPTLAELVDHYREIELIEGNGKTARTIAVYSEQPDPSSTFCLSGARIRSD